MSEERREDHCLVESPSSSRGKGQREGVGSSDLAVRRAALVVLKPVVTTVAHYVNNELQACSLELENLMRERRLAEGDVAVIQGVVCRYLRRVAAVLRALHRLEEVRVIPYADVGQMIDIDRLLQEELRRLSDEG